LLVTIQNVTKSKNKAKFERRRPFYTTIEVCNATVCFIFLVKVFCAKLVFYSEQQYTTRSQAVARIADRTAKNCKGHVT